MPIISEYLLY
ncbi:hypothetical protein VTL71DRAFT_14444 [Oculimacula yallundae]|uniref:Uncharacterized protein n=1 Tax=Oculimacula yallundae TaxID=86028 RepID=A0ABR4CIG4_9HELO